MGDFVFGPRRAATSPRPVISLPFCLPRLPGRILCDFSIKSRGAEHVAARIDWPYQSERRFPIIRCWVQAKPFLNAVPSSLSLANWRFNLLESLTSWRSLALLLDVTTLFVLLELRPGVLLRLQLARLLCPPNPSGKS